MKRGIAIFLGLLALSACNKTTTEQGVLVNLTNPAATTGIVQLRVSLSNHGSTNSLLFPPNQPKALIGFPTSFSFAVAAPRNGQLDLVVEALDASSFVVANAATSVALESNRFVSAPMVLQPGPTLCGNGQLDQGEPCDDGNHFSGDGCDYLCRSATAQDASLEIDVGSGIDGSTAVDAAGTVDTGGGDTGVDRFNSADVWVQFDVPLATGGAGGMGGGMGTRFLDAAVRGGTTGSGGLVSTGGTVGTGGKLGTGGTIVGTGGVVASGGAMATGGMVGTGGSGAGGSPVACQEGAAQCLGNGVQTCSNSQWGGLAPCGPRQTCTGPEGNKRCTCNVDPVCSAVGGVCSTASTLVNCAQDLQGCYYQASAQTCSGACEGPAGASSCCTNTCVVGTTQCLSNTTLQTCTLGANGCTAYALSTCDNGACSGSPESASCCTNACVPGTTCQSSTTLQTCAVESNGCTSNNPTTCSAGLVCERNAPAACLDPAWAQWPIPNGQVDVAAGAPNLASYTDNGNGTVTDNITGLVWQQAVPIGTYTWEQAKAYCPTLTLAGHADWRLPKRIELVSIVDFGRSSPAIDTTYFPSTPSSHFWTSSPFAGSSSVAWRVRFDIGYPDHPDASNSCNIRCVR